MRAIQFSRFGGPEVLQYVELADPVAGPGQVLIEVEAAGVNFSEVHQVDGSYLKAELLPWLPGSEVVGRTPDGRRVLARVRGGYAELAVADERFTVEIGEEIPGGQALALLMQGLTAWHILRSAARIQPGETVVVHSAAGGVGHMAVQLAKAFGAGQVLAQASTPAKRELALSLGADGVADYPLAERVDVILDAVGGELFDQALDSLKDFGRLVVYGNASGLGHTHVDPNRLSDLNVALVGFWLLPTLELPGTFTEPIKQMLDLVSAGKLTPMVGAEYPLAEAHRAHQDLINRTAMGKLVLRA